MKKEILIFSIIIGIFVGVMIFIIITLNNDFDKKQILCEEICQTHNLKCIDFKYEGKDILVAECMDIKDNKFNEFNIKKYIIDSEGLL